MVKRLSRSQDSLNERLFVGVTNRASKKGPTEADPFWFQIPPARLLEGLCHSDARKRVCDAFRNSVSIPSFFDHLLPLCMSAVDVNLRNDSPHRDPPHVLKFGVPQFVFSKLKCVDFTRACCAFCFSAFGHSFVHDHLGRFSPDALSPSVRQYSTSRVVRFFPNFTEAIPFESAGRSVVVGGVTVTVTTNTGRRGDNNNTYLHQSTLKVRTVLTFNPAIPGIRMKTRNHADCNETAPKEPTVLRSTRLQAKTRQARSCWRRT